jgi:hypothetical protein
VRAARLVATGLAAVVLGGCASAEDVATENANGARKAGESPVATPRSTSQPSKSSPSQTPEPTSSSPTDSPSTSPPGNGRRRNLPNVVGAIPTFVTPSHNIGCAIGAGQVRCDIGEHVYRAPRKPADCDGDYGQSLAVTTTGIATFICVTDTVIDRRAPVLSYGTSTVVGDFGCTSRQAGIRCYYLKSKHGFWLSQEQPVVF